MDASALLITCLSLLVVLVCATTPLLLAWHRRELEVERRVREELEREQRRRVQQLQRPPSKGIGFQPDRPEPHTQKDQAHAEEDPS